MKLTGAIILICAMAGCSAPMVYVASSKGDVAVIDASSRKVVATFHVEGGPEGIAASESRPRVYIANFWGNAVVGVNTRTHKVEEEIRCYYPWGVAVKPTR